MAKKRLTIKRRKQTPRRKPVLPATTPPPAAPPPVASWATRDDTDNLIAAQEAVRQRGFEAAMSGSSGPPFPPGRPQVVTVDTPVTRATVPIVPTLYPDDPDGPVIVQNYITIKIESPEFRRLNAKIDELLEALRQSNERSEAHDQALAEIAAGKNLLTAPKPDRNLVDLLLLRPLKYLVEKAGSAIISELAKQAVDLLLRLLSGGP
jgi:hypothetical protein